MQRRAFSTASQLHGGLSEFGKTGDGEVLLVGPRVLNDLFRLLHAGEDIWLPILVPVGPDTQVDFAGILVGLEGLSDTYITRRSET